MRQIPVALLFCLPLAHAQSAMPAKFDVASIRTSQSDAHSSSGLPTTHGSLIGNNVTLKRCIIGAYNVGPQQITGGPPWLDSERFEIRAKVDQDINDDAALMVMLRDLLGERFKLALHKETKLLHAFVLEVSKSGPNLEKATPGESSTQTSSGAVGITINARRTSLDAFARILSRRTDLIVVNKTGLEGTYNFKLEWTPERMKASTSEAGSAYPSLVTAIQEQLGLRLRSEKTPVETLVIDHAEMPSAN